MQKNTNLFQKAATLQAAHTPFVMVTIVKSLGSTPRHHGKMLVQAHGSIEGTIGGGPAEARAIKEALNRLESGESGMAKYVLNRVADASGTASSPEAIQPAHPVALASGGTGDISGTGASSAEVLPMECGGGLELLFEVYGKASTLVLIGGGHVNFEIGQLGHRLGYRIVVVDSRAEFSSSERFPFAWKCITSENAEELFSQVSLGSHDAIIIATPNHDESSLRQILNKINSLDTPLGFLGMIGSRNKVLRIKQRLLADGFTPAQVKALRSPVGLDIGAETPEEIAVSVMAEVMSVMHGTTAKPLSQKFADLVVVRGGGDLASGVIHKLFRAGMPVVVLEQEQPTVIRRTVSFAEAVFQGQTTVEGVTARRIDNPAEFRQVLDAGQVPVLVDPDMQLVKRLKPTVLIDATLAKRNMGISKDLAGKVIALGPGFEAGKDVHMVIETSRGHYLGSIITQGKALPNTGVPGNIVGYTKERIIRAPAEGVVVGALPIGTQVKKGETLGFILPCEDACRTSVAAESSPKDALPPKDARTPIVAPLTGVLRGMIHEGVLVKKEMKIGDIDPRNNSDYIQTLSDKAKSVGGAVLEAILMRTKGENHE